MNLPKVVSDLLKTQNNFDSVAYANCFTETAVVFDEGKTHNGRKEIEKWIDEANKKYQATMKPLDYSETGHTLEAEISGNFPCCRRSLHHEPLCKANTDFRIYPVQIFLTEGQNQHLRKYSRVLVLARLRVQ